MLNLYARKEKILEQLFRSPQIAICKCDTEYNPDMIEQITGVSTIYHDCTYSETDKERAKKHFHSTAAQAANTAKQAEAGTLILGHFSARYNNENILLEEAKEIFKNSYLAKENATFTIE